MTAHRIPEVVVVRRWPELSRVWLLRQLFPVFFCIVYTALSTPPLIADEPASKRDCWTLQNSGVIASLRGLCAVSADICWASGSGGTVLKTVDGGRTWISVAPADCSAMDFRDIHARSEFESVIMTAGDPDRLYRTSDGGKSWTVVFEHPVAAAFFDGMAFAADGKSGWLMGDPVDGHLCLVVTQDSGRTWTMPAAVNTPELNPGIAGFAASGTNLCLTDQGTVIIGLGGLHPPDIDPRAIVYSTSDHGGTWQFARLPIKASASAGVFSVTAVDATGEHLVAVGGDYLKPAAASDNIALSDDSGITWRLPKFSSPRGFRSAVASVRNDDDKQSLVAVGPSGTDVSEDRGDSWAPVSGTGFHTLSFAGESHGWGAGSDGRIGVWRND